MQAITTGIAAIRAQVRMFGMDSAPFFAVPLVVAMFIRPTNTRAYQYLCAFQVNRLGLEHLSQATAICLPQGTALGKCDAVFMPSNGRKRDSGPSCQVRALARLG